MNSRSPADRRAVRRIAAFAAAVVLLAPSVALAAVPPYYDIATNSDQPASTAERGQTYLLYNLNPLRNETVTIDDKITTPSNAAGTASKPVGSGIIPFVAPAACSASSTAGCVANLAALVNHLHDFVGTFSQSNAVNVDKRAAAVVTAALETFKPSVEFGPAATISDEVNAYVSFLNAHVLTTGVSLNVGSAVDPYRSLSIADERNKANDVITAVKVAMASVKDADKSGVLVELDAANAALKELDSSVVTSVAAKADAAANTWAGIVSTKQTDAFYKAVKAPCTPSGFKIHTYTVKVLRGSDTQWTCVASAKHLHGVRVYLEPGRSARSLHGLVKRVGLFRAHYSGPRVCGGVSLRGDRGNDAAIEFLQRGVGRVEFDQDARLISVFDGRHRHLHGGDDVVRFVALVGDAQRTIRIDGAPDIQAYPSRKHVSVQEAHVRIDLIRDSGRRTKFYAGLERLEGGRHDGGRTLVNVYGIGLAERPDKVVQMIDERGKVSNATGLLAVPVALDGVVILSSIVTVSFRKGLRL